MKNIIFLNPYLGWYTLFSILTELEAGSTGTHTVAVGVYQNLNKRYRRGPLKSEHNVTVRVYQNTLP